MDEAAEPVAAADLARRRYLLSLAIESLCTAETTFTPGTDASAPVGCTNWISLGGFVFVKQAAEEVGPLDL